MALTTCPSCGHDVDDKAHRCPGCGARTPHALRIAHLNNILFVIAILVALLVGGLWYAHHRDQQAKRDACRDVSKIVAQNCES